MATAIVEPVSPFVAEADLQAIADAIALGRKLDPETVARVRHRSDAARRANQARMGVQDIGVQIIREMRDAE